VQWEILSASNPSLRKIPPVAWYGPAAPQRRVTASSGRRENGFSHRWAFQYEHGFLPEAVLHICDNPPCVRHLKAGTRGENNTDRARKGRNANRWGENNPGCKVTADAQVAEMQRKFKTGSYTRTQLAEEYGVSRPHVSYLLNGKRGKGRKN
jgi:hypothetical protein